MTITTQNRTAGPFAGNGVTAVFPFTFKVFQASDLKVVQRVDSTEAETTLLLNSNYTVAINPNQNANPGGTVTLTSPLAVGLTLTITTELEYLQQTDLTNQGGFYPQVVTNAFDRLTIFTQQLLAGLNRSLKYPLSDSGINPTLPGKNALRGNVLAFHESTGRPVAGPSIAAIGTVANSNAAILTVANNIADVNTVADNIADVNTVADNIADVNAVAANMADVNAVAANMADVNAVATNMADVTNFADVYSGPRASDPSTRTDGSPLVQGDLYFNTETDRLRVFTGTRWSEANTGAVAVQQFTGDGVTVDFQLNSAPDNENVVQVFVGGAYQSKTVYDITGPNADILTFTSAPPNGAVIEAVTFSVLPLGVVDANQMLYRNRTGFQKLKDVRDIRDFGAIPLGDSAVNTDAMNAAIAEAIADGDLSIRARGRYTFADTILLNSQGLHLDLGSCWGNRFSLDAGSSADALMRVDARLVVVNGGMLIAPSNKIVLAVDGSNAQLFKSHQTVVREGLYGVYHEKANSSEITSMFIESCTYGYVMEPSGNGDTNGCFLSGRSFNCEFGFDMRVNKAPTGAGKDPLHNTIHWSCEGNTVGFKQRGGYYNELHIYSESNNRVSTMGNTNTNYDTDGSGNLWFTKNPDNTPDIIKEKAAGWNTTGTNIQLVAPRRQSGAQIRDFAVSGGLVQEGARVYVITNSSGSTRGLTLSFISNMGIGDSISVFKTDNTAGFTLTPPSGITLLGDTGTFGAFVVSGVAEMTVTRISSSQCIVQQHSHTV